MAENKEETYSETSECSSALTMSMASKCRYLFHRLWGSTDSWNKSTSPKGRRVFHRDVEKEEFQYASSHCLSSYYSVFVVRLAIMVSFFFFFLFSPSILVPSFASNSMIYVKKHVLVSYLCLKLHE